ncbi:MAG TPA: hypothetical protein VFL91_23475 [Thermomicrobiales bacterium]|nr:hypothetical protein [Thermomicrobiales bacterium]
MYVPPDWTERLTLAAEVARRDLDPVAADRAWAEGEARSLEQAAAEMLESLEFSPAGVPA